MNLMTFMTVMAKIRRKRYLSVLASGRFRRTDVGMTIMFAIKLV